MPFPIAHSLAGVATCCLVSELNNKRIMRFVIYIFAANLPDVDFIPYMLFPSDMTHGWHHAASHSFAFAAVAAIVIGLAARRVLNGRFSFEFAMLFILMVTHVFLDYLTYAPRPPAGVMMFFPLSYERFSSPYLLFATSLRDSRGDLIPGLLSMGLAKEHLLELAVFGPLVYVSAVIRKKIMLKECNR